MFIEESLYESTHEESMFYIHVNNHGRLEMC